MFFNCTTISPPPLQHDDNFELISLQQDKQELDKMIKTLSLLIFQLKLGRSYRKWLLAKSEQLKSCKQKKSVHLQSFCISDDNNNKTMIAQLGNERGKKWKVSCTVKRVCRTGQVSPSLVLLSQWEEAVGIQHRPTNRKTSEMERRENSMNVCASC